MSFKGRDLELGVRNTSVDMIQTDAAINPGNSGGPLINTRGEVVGINTLIVTGGAQASAGVGFSVPINVAKDILPQLRDKGKVMRGWMGVTIGPMTRGPRGDLRPRARRKGAIVNSVTPGSPAEKAGLQPEDAILTADGRTIQDNGDLSRYIASLAARHDREARPGARQGEEERQRDARRRSRTRRPEDDERRRRPRQPRHDAARPDARRWPSASGLPRDTHGVVVIEVEAGEAAEDAGLIRGDVIVTVNGQPVATHRGLSSARSPRPSRTAVRGCASTTPRSTAIA